MENGRKFFYDICGEIVGALKEKGGKAPYLEFLDTIRFVLKKYNIDGNAENPVWWALVSDPNTHIIEYHTGDILKGKIDSSLKLVGELDDNFVRNSEKNVDIFVQRTKHLASV